LTDVVSEWDNADTECDSDFSGQCGNASEVKFGRVRLHGSKR